MLLFTNEHVTYKNIQNYKYIESMHHKTRVYAPRVTFVLIYLKLAYESCVIQHLIFILPKVHFHWFCGIICLDAIAISEGILLTEKCTL